MKIPNNLTEVISTNRLTLHTAKSALAAAEDALRNARSTAKSNIAGAFRNLRSTFDNQETGDVASIAIPQLITGAGELPSEADLQTILTWLEYTLSAGKRGVKEQIPFCLIDTKQVSGSARRGGSNPGESWEQQDSMTNIIVGYLEGIRLSSITESGIQPTLTSHRHVSVTVNIDTLVGPVTDQPFAHQRSHGSVSIESDEQHLLYSLLGPRFASMIQSAHGVNLGVQLYVGDQFTERTSDLESEYQALITTLKKMLDTPA